MRLTTPVRLRILSRHRAWLAYLLVLVICALPLFGHLDEPPVQVWDEMRNGINALEMNHTGRLIVTTYDYAPETWNTKPPLLIWILALSFRILGSNELALRLPSALAALATCILLLRFARRHTGRWGPGILAVGILVTIPGYVNSHGTRTGDFDALLVLCTTAAAFWFFSYMEYGRDKWLYFSVAAITAAVLTKGVAGLFVLPSMALYAMLRGKALMILRQRAVWLSLAGLLAVAGGFYVLREAQQPGFLHAVYVNELGGRYNTLIKGIHDSGPLAYYDELVNSAFTPWLLLPVPAVCAALMTRRRRWQRVGQLCVLLAVSLLLILSGATTRLWWYMMPIYPALALLCGMFLYQMMTLLSRGGMGGSPWRMPVLIPAMLLLALFWRPYSNILDITIGDKFPKISADVHDAGVYLKEVSHGMRPLGGQVLCGEAPLPLHWYQEVLRERGMNLDIKSAESLMPCDKVLAWDEATKRRIRERYRQTEVENFRLLTIFRIDGKAGEP